MSPRLRAPRLAAALAVLLAGAALAADHSDGWTITGGKLEGLGRSDANILNFFAFKRVRQVDGKDLSVLVLALHIDDTVLPTATTYRFAEDLTIEFHVDNDSEVIRTEGHADPSDFDRMMRFGGTVVDPDKINEDVTFKVQFKETEDGGTAPKLVLEGLPARSGPIRTFTGLRRATQRRAAAVVVEVPLALVAPDPGKPLLLWVTSKVPEVEGPISDTMGLPNTSRLNMDMNESRPRHHSDFLLVPPAEQSRADVLIFDTSKDATQHPRPVTFNASNPGTFPNGRLPDPAIGGAAAQFPYLAPPQ